MKKRSFSMNDRSNDKIRFTDDISPHEVAELSTDAVMEVELQELKDEELELVSGGSDGTAIGHN
jgi:hypothetical protein